MSPFALLSTAVAIPLAVVVVVFIGFFLYAQIASLFNRILSYIPLPKKRTGSNELSDTHITSYSSVTSISPEGLTIVDSPYSLSPSHSAPTFQPISHFLSDTLTTTLSDSSIIQFDLKDIPGINESIQHELYELGYTSVEQIARWGRADVRAVSALLEIDQQKIEDEWIAGARFILSI